MILFVLLLVSSRAVYLESKARAEYLAVEVTALDSEKALVPSGEVTRGNETEVLRYKVELTMKKAIKPQPLAISFTDNLIEGTSLKIHDVFTIEIDKAQTEYISKYTAHCVINVRLKTPESKEMYEKIQSQEADIYFKVIAGRKAQAVTALTIK